MHPLINHLVQLQELSLIRDEQKAHKRTDRLEQLDASIQNLSDQLPPDVRRLFQTLRKRSHLVVVPVSNSVCAGCGMKLPISLIQSVRSGAALHHCATCMKILYVPESPVRHVAKIPRRTSPQKLGIQRFSSQRLMIPRLQADDRDSAIRQLATKMQAECFVDNAERLVELALERENMLSTAVDHGVAFPHVRGVEGGGLTFALGLSPTGIKFTDDPNSLTKIIFFMVIPIAASAFYLKLIAGLAETFLDTEARKALMAEKEPDKLWKTLVKITRKTVP